MLRSLLALAVVSVGFVAGCPNNTDTTPKPLAVAVWGEEFIEQEIPASDTDGWTIGFDVFLINIGEVEVRRIGGFVASSPGAAVFDLASPSGGAGFKLADLAAPTSSGLHAISYRVLPATAANAGNASAADAEFMAANGYSIYVEISATDGTLSKRLAFGLAVDATYSNCFTTIDFEAAGGGAVQLTVHGDHFFLADLSDGAAVRFAAVAAADANADGEITAEELAAVPLDPSTGATNLLDLITKLAATVGHIDGEGHCAAVTVN